MKNIKIKHLKKKKDKNENLKSSNGEVSHHIQGMINNNIWIFF